MEEDREIIKDSMQKAHCSISSAMESLTKIINEIDNTNDEIETKKSTLGSKNIVASCSTELADKIPIPSIIDILDQNLGNTFTGNENVLFTTEEKPKRVRNRPKKNKFKEDDKSKNYRSVTEENVSDYKKSHGKIDKDKTSILKEDNNSNKRTDKRRERAQNLRKMKYSEHDNERNFSEFDASRPILTTTRNIEINEGKLYGTREFQANSHNSEQYNQRRNGRFSESDCNIQIPTTSRNIEINVGKQYVQDRTREFQANSYGSKQYNQRRNDRFSESDCNIQIPTTSGNIEVNVERKNEQDGKEKTDCLSKEVCLIIKMLQMTPDERERFLIVQAKERQILIRNHNTKGFEYNKKLMKEYNKMEQRKHDLHKTPANNDKPLKLPQILFDKDKTNTNAARKLKNTVDFADQVNAFLYGNDYEENENLLLLKNKNTDLENKSFQTEENQKNLAEFVNQLTEKKMGYLIDGEIRINARNNHEGYITNSRENINTKDTLVSTNILRQCALHGDRVLAFVKNSTDAVSSGIKENLNTSNDDNLEETTELECELLDTVVDDKAKVCSTGFVITILDKIHPRVCVGQFFQYRKTLNDCTFAPRDPKLGMISISHDNLPDAIKNVLNDENAFKMECDTLYLAEIIDETYNELIGRIQKSVGRSGVLEDENLGILLQNNITPVKFSQEIIESLPKTFELPEEELNIRMDIRDQCIFTIDPATARDLDDAVSCRTLDNGNFEVGVHISDVTHFVQEKSDLDEIIKSNTTSIYMVDQVYHMLPVDLCLLCSLLPGQDKLSFSVFWEFTRDGKILNKKFTKSLMNSCCKLAYEHAQNVIENPNKEFQETDFPEIYNGFKPIDIVNVIKNLQSIALLLRKARFENGALRIDQPKLRFSLDPTTGKPISYTSEQRKESNCLIEDFMLLANQSVADFIYNAFPNNAILRNHLPPDANQLKKLTTLLEKIGMKFDVNSSKAIRESIAKLISTSKTPEGTSCILNQLSAKTMTRAKYFCSEHVKSYDECWHYALSIPIYTHFTSPIRRYPDILVHRLLSAALEGAKEPTRSTEELHKIVNACNVQKYNAKLASDESSNLYFMHYLKSIGSIRLKAVVLNVQEYSMDVMLIDTGHQIKIIYRTLRPEIDVFYVRNSTLQPKIKIVPISYSFLKPFHLKMFSECLIEVSAYKDKLKGILIPTLFEEYQFKYRTYAEWVKAERK